MAACVATSARTLHAQDTALGPELIVNGDFSAASPPPARALGGWTATGPTTQCGFYGAGNSYISLNGTGAGCLVPQFYFGPSSTAALQQTVATSAGLFYRISFFAQAQPFYAGPAVFSAYWGSTLLTTVDVGRGLPGQTFNFFASAADVATVLRFEDVVPGPCPARACDDWGNIVALDNVSVRALAAVPEPSTWALLGVGLVPLARAARRRTRGGSAV